MLYYQLLFTSLILYLYYTQSFSFPFNSRNQFDKTDFHQNPMEFLHSQNIFFCLFHFSCFLLNSSAYTMPEQYFINCGSSTSTPVGTFGSRMARITFVGDVNPSNFTLSTSHSNIANNPSTDSLYQTARIFRKKSSYDFDIVQNGTYVVRFHFYAFPSQDNLENARFNVSASNSSLLSNFSVQKSSVTNHSAIIKEFLISINEGKFQIFFIPSNSSSFAFINALEAFLAPDRFIPNSAPYITPAGRKKDDCNGLLSTGLQVFHRINVGGSLVTPENDTLGRNWIPDDDYLVLRDAATDTPPRSGRPNYQFWPTEFDAPDAVYNTAKQLNINSSQEGINLPPVNFNVSWRFTVNKNSRFLVRMHFCDVISPAACEVSKFNLYIYSNFGQIIDPHATGQTMLAIPFYYDFVVDSDDSRFMNIIIGPSQDSKSAFLNGVEIMELFNVSGSCPKDCQEGKKHLPVIIGSVAGGVVVVIIAVVLLWLSLKLRKGKTAETHDWQLPRMNLNGESSYNRSTERKSNGSPLPDLNLGLKIPFGEILYATKNFDEKLIIGEGGFGKVYRGTLRDGTKVAVKRSEPGRTQGLPEFQTEIMVLSIIRHRHLVSLIGYCDEKSEMVLVYEFMEKGTLRDHLYASKEEHSTKAMPEHGLSWDKRLNLCIDAAKGLHYLHTALGGSIIHRDVKSTNIPLDEHYVAKVADFGISRLGPLDQSHVSTEVKGSFGYLDPEYFRCLQLTQKSDVYSFGVVLLEVLCARPAIDNLLPREQVNLAEWGMSCLEKGQLDKIIDPLLVGKINSNSLRKFGETVEKCLEDCGVDRPNMVDVLWDLEYVLQLQHTAIPTQPHEDSNTDVSYNLPQEVVHRLPSHSIAMSEDEMASDTHYDRSGTSASDFLPAQNGRRKIIFHVEMVAF